MQINTCHIFLSRYMLIRIIFPLDLSIYLQISFHFLSWVISIVNYTTFSLSIYPMIDIWVVSNFWGSSNEHSWRSTSVVRWTFWGVYAQERCSWILKCIYSQIPEELPHWFYKDCIRLHSYKQRISILLTPHAGHHELLFVFFFNLGHSEWGVDEEISKQFSSMLC